MFGYVIVNERQLSEDEHRRMRAFYCGVCRALKKRYGLSGERRFLPRTPSSKKAAFIIGFYAKHIE